MGEDVLTSIPAETPTVTRSPALGELFKALAKARARMAAPTKDKTNPHLKNRYADLGSVLAAVVPALTEAGLVLVQLPCELGDGPALCTMLAHTSGEWLQTVIKLRPTKAGAQEVGSALTYARRYAVQSLCSITAEDDDDGHAASRPRGEQRPQERPRQQPANGTPAEPTQDDRVRASKLVARAGAAKASADLDAVARDAVGLPPSLFETLKGAVTKRRAELLAAAGHQQQAIPAANGPYAEGR